MAARTQLGERLLERGVITETQLADGLRAQQVTGEELGNALMRLGHVGEDDFMRLLCEDADIPFLELDDVRPSEEAIRVIPEALARAHGVLPLNQENGRIRVALGNPFDIGAVTALERISGRPITVVAARRAAINGLLNAAYGPGGRSGGSGGAPPGPPTTVGRSIPTPAPKAPPARPAPSAGSRESSPTRPRPATPPPPPPAPAPARPGVAAAQAAPPAELPADELVRRGVALGATDIRIEPGPAGTRVRYRIDGQLQVAGLLSSVEGRRLGDRLRSLAGLEGGLTGIPLEGRLRLAMDPPVDVRLSSLPTVHGEDLVLRVRDRSGGVPELNALGLEGEELELARAPLRATQGLVVVAGLAGTGRTTTLYALLREIDAARRSILTLEDPVEHELDGVRQSAVDPGIGYTFHAGLASLLRHDPDVIMLGELRETDTVQRAAGAALTGPLVLAGMAAESAPGAVVRLLRMGAEAYALASSLRLVVAQRLVRVLCTRCRTPADVAPEVRQRYGLGEATVYRARGCTECRQTGYSGRTGVFELLPAGPGLARAIYDDPTVEAIRAAGGRPTLLQAGLRKAIAGATSLDEVLNVAGG